VPGPGDHDARRPFSDARTSLVDGALVAAHQQGRELRREDDRRDLVDAPIPKREKRLLDRRLGETHPRLDRPGEQSLECSGLVSRHLDER
jgi:hypothetical protein